MTSPYGGVQGFAEDLRDLIEDLAGRTCHGMPGGLTGRQQGDLAEFLLSIHGDLTAAIRDPQVGDRVRLRVTLEWGGA